MDGTGELGLTRLLFRADQEDTLFYGTSDEGDIVLCDWGVKPPGGKERGKEEIAPEYIIDYYISERNLRPTLEFQRSPFFEDILLTVHDFYFAIWKTSLKGYKEPIFRSSYTQGAHNTCGCWSPTRPGVIYITKTNGIDVWDLLDQSHKPSMKIGNIASPIMFIKFQEMRQADNAQFMAFGDQTEGTFFLYRVPKNLKTAAPGELQLIDEFWEREINKCLYQKERRETRVEERDEEEKRKAIEEQRKADEIVKDDAETLRIQEEEEEAEYQALLMQTRFDLGEITEQEFNDWKDEQKKK